MINKNQNEEFKSKENCCSSVSTYRSKIIRISRFRNLTPMQQQKRHLRTEPLLHGQMTVTKGNDTLLDWINEEIKTLGEEQFFHADYEETLKDTYGSEYEDSLVVEGGETK